MNPGHAPRSVVIHGHFYQPPRDDPWLDIVRHEPSAAPAHDWNERIEQECYRAVTAARTQDAGGRIVSIRNTLEWISFNVGPTLLEWMERHAPDTYRAVLEADARALRRTGYGTALAQPYHHAILPLASPRDRRTEIRWGVADFERRFGRRPLGMWLPETAVDLDTLDDLAAEGIAFTIVGDHQVERAPADGRPGRVVTSGGREIALFCYDGPLSHGVAFGNLLKDAGAWARAMLKGVPPAESPLPGDGSLPAGAALASTPDPGRPLVSGDRPEGPSDGHHPHPDGPVADGHGGHAAHADSGDAPWRDVVLLATDGETFGHHHPFGDMALASLLDRLQKHPRVRVEPLAAVLARVPPRETLTLHSPSAWSCSHGVERWASDCGCRMTSGTSQAWRAPLRTGLATLAEGLHQVFETEARGLGIADPWALRDAMGEVVGAPPEAWVEHVDVLVPPGTPPEDRVRLRTLLEMERDVLRSFTSCGWFFDDIAGIEGLQVLRYAARALELAGSPHREGLEAELLTHLARAEPNDPALGTAADLYRKEVLPHVSPEERVAAGAAAVAGLVPHVSLTPGMGAWWAQVDARPSGDAGAWQVRVTHRRTGASVRIPLEVERPAPGKIRVRLDRTAGVPPLVLDPGDLPEPQGVVVAGALRAELIRRWLTAADRDRLVAGETTVGRLALDQLCRGLSELEGAGSLLLADRLGLLMALAELVRLAQDGSLFDAQTRLHRTRETLEPEARGVLDPLASLLGFAGPEASAPRPAVS